MSRNLLPLDNESRKRSQEMLCLILFSTEFEDSSLEQNKFRSIVWFQVPSIDTSTSIWVAASTASTVAPPSNHIQVRVMDVFGRECECEIVE